MITAHGVTHPGRVRPSNEDAMHCDIPNGVFVVADGMGGHQAGEVASQLAIDTIRAFLASTQGDRDLTWPYGFNPALSFNGNRLLTAIKLANRRVYQAGEEEQTYAGMGTTIVAAMIDQNRLTFGGVGDSRLYMLNPESFDQLTHDDSWVATVLAKEPGVDESTLARHPMRHVLTNVVGARDETDVEIGERTLQSGQILLLCSDGLHGTLDDAAMQLIVGGGGEVADLAHRLIDAALERNASDNVTAVLVRYTADPTPDPAP
jgi:PPM family protein phosphatase